MRLKTFSPSEPPLAAEDSSRMESVAGLLTALPPAVAESVLDKMGPAHSERLREHMRDFSETSPPKESLDHLLTELERRMAAERQTPLRLPRLAAPAEPEAKPPPRKEIAIPAPKQEQAVSAEPPVDDAEPADDREVIPKLRLWTAGQLAAVLTGEQSNVVALVLHCLEANKAGQVLKLMPPKVCKEAFLSMLGAKPPAKLTVQVGRTLMRKSQALRQNQQSENGPLSSEEKYRRMACLLRAQPADIRNEMLKSLEQLDPGTAVRIKDQLYTFEDLLLLDDRSVQKVLRQIKMEFLTFALIGGDENIKDIVLRNLSKRASELLLEELAARPTAPAAKVQEGQQEVIRAILQADAAGELTWAS